MTFWDVPGARKFASLTIVNKHLQGQDEASLYQINFSDVSTLNQVKLHVIKMPDCAARTNCRLPPGMFSFQEQGGHKWQH